MKKERQYPAVLITKKGEISLRGGHPWVYEAEITEERGEPVNGELVDVLSSKGRYLGTGFFNRHSKIRVRVISDNTNDTFDEAFFRRRLSHAWEYRKTVMGAEDLSCCRLIFGEADRFPGLTVDRFGPILVTQTLSLGMEHKKQLLFPALVDLLRQDGQKIQGIYERNDVAIRKLEGMEEGKGFFPLENLPIPESTVTEIVENGIRYSVDFENGQKTGFFFFF